MINSHLFESKKSNSNLSIFTWAFLTKLIFELMNKGNFIPILEKESDNLYKGNWRLILKNNSDNERFQLILKNCHWSSFNLPINLIIQKDKNMIKTDGIWHPSYLFSKFIDDLGDLLIRFILKNAKFNAFNDYFSSEIKLEKTKEYGISWDYRFLKALLKKEKQFQIKRFHETIIPKIIRNWVQISQGALNIRGGSLIFELEYPKETENDWPLSFSLGTQNKSVIPIKDFLEKETKQKKEILKFYDNEEEFLEALLRAFGTASKIFPPIKRSLEHRFPTRVLLNSSEVMDFLKYPKDLLIQNGFNIILPEVFLKGGKQRLNSKFVIKSKVISEKGKTSEISSIFNINSLLDYKWEGNLEGVNLTDEEFKKLIENKDPLINWRGKWVLIEQENIEELREIFEQKKHFGKLNYMDALKLGLTGNIQLEQTKTNYEVIIEGDFNEIINKIKSLENFKQISTPSSFKGILRPYQETGLTWMANMSKFNFGLCLADDMGLGKTIQIIAYLLYLKETEPNLKSGSYLIICPMSVLFNWIREINKFAPNLELILHHGTNRIKELSKVSKYKKAHLIVLTTYGTIRNDIDLLSSVEFRGIIIDEIQNIKNYNSKKTKAIYRLQSEFRIGLSGTPIENRLMELWTLFEFLNPSLLGNRIDFQKDFIIPISRFQDMEAINKLKSIIAPFLLRRVKTDKNIISDLPEKNEIKIFIELSEIQKNIYKNLVEEVLKEINTKFSDKLNMLNILVKLKQVCNHPFQYLKKKAPEFQNRIEFKEFLSQSHKLERLLEMTNEVISNGEKVLIFTQFTKMGEIIKKIFEYIYDFEILYFHGGVPEKKRKDIVDAFQLDDIDSPPILILSLKAGGTGLNLTRGTTVIHYDSPWNPATQDQATDRAYRIGQKFPVNVYRFITIGTIEEKIETLLEEKRDLAKKVIETQSESFILDFDKDKLISLLTLDI